MYYATRSQIADRSKIAGSAQQMNDTAPMAPYYYENYVKTPEHMLHIIAAALNEQPTTYKLKTRIRNVVELRFIAALCLRSNFPTITLQQIAMFFGGQDHTSVINGLTRAYALIYAGDESFTKKYKAALAAVNLWLKNGVE